MFRKYLLPVVCLGAWVLPSTAATLSGRVHDQTGESRADAVVQVGALSENLEIRAAGTPKASTPPALSQGGDVKKPKLRKMVKPVYPPAAKEAGLEGEVKLRVRIGKDGLVKEMTEMPGSIAELVPAAKEAVGKWEYEPVEVDGKAVEVQADVTLNFRLKQ